MHTIIKDVQAAIMKSELWRIPPYLSEITMETDLDEYFDLLETRAVKYLHDLPAPASATGGVGTTSGDGEDNVLPLSLMASTGRENNNGSNIENEHADDDDDGEDMVMS